MGWPHDLEREKTGQRSLLLVAPEFKEDPPLCFEELCKGIRMMTPRSTMCFKVSTLSAREIQDLVHVLNEKKLFYRLTFLHDGKAISVEYADWYL